MSLNDVLFCSLRARGKWARDIIQTVLLRITGICVPLLSLKHSFFFCFFLKLPIEIIPLLSFRKE